MSGDSSKFFNNPSGFTILELMVGVGIAGALAAIAIPSYCRYASRARQAQAKNALSAIYVAEKSFAIDNQSYTSCIGYLGVQPPAKTTTNYYAAGFNAASAGLSKCGKLQLSPCNQYSFTTTSPPTCQTTTYSYGQLNGIAYKADANADKANTTIPGINQLTPKVTPLPANVVTSTSFFAMAVGNISGCNSAYDRWSIDEKNNLVNWVPSL